MNQKSRNDLLTDWTEEKELNNGKKDNKIKRQMCFTCLLNVEMTGSLKIEEEPKV